MSWGGVMADHLGWGIIEEGWRKGPWTTEEDRLLIEYVKLHGEGRWNSVARLQGLKRNGKSCRLRWVNYLRPDLKRGQITPHEESIILELHAKWGNRWSTIARSLPGRTDNEIKNYWRTHFKKKAKTPPSDMTAKSKARVLRRQQFQQQQQQNQVDMKKKMLDETDINNIRVPILPHHQYHHHQVMMKQQDMASPNNYSTTADQEQQAGCFCTLFNGYAAVLPEAASSSNEDFLWDGLWNLDDDVHGNFSPVSAATRATLQSLATPCSFF